MDINRVRWVSLIVTLLIMGILTLIARTIPDNQRPGTLATIKSRLKIQRALLQVNHSEIKVLVETQPSANINSSSSATSKETTANANRSL